MFLYGLLFKNMGNNKKTTMIVKFNYKLTNHIGIR